MFVSTEVEILMNSIERLQDYIENTPKEESDEAPIEEIKEDWPSNGTLVFDNYTTGYREGPNVLTELSFTISNQEKIGIVGRTGSGKSTMILSLLRIIEARQGRILLDGIDISMIPLETLRTALGLIPQDPVCFIGSIRYNLDPFNKYSDKEIWNSLKNVQLQGFVESQRNGLDYMIEENGENISVGQRQLLCIARALLRDTKILMLDEATASVDKDTDTLLQATIRKCFEDRTVLTIAHRLETILDSTKILVLNKGRVAEFDTPERLLSINDGIFASMVEAAKNK